MAHELYEEVEELLLFRVSLHAFQGFCVASLSNVGQQVCIFRRHVVAFLQSLADRFFRKGRDVDALNAALYGA